MTRDRESRLYAIAATIAGATQARRSELVALLHSKGMLVKHLPLVPFSDDDSRKPLSSAQARIWFEWKLDPEGWNYNVPTTLRLYGNLDLEALNRAFIDVANRHQIFRTIYGEGTNGDPFQEVLDCPANLIVFQELGHATNAESSADLHRQIVEECKAPFKLNAELPIRVRLIRLSNEEHILIVVTHHIAIDGWSCRLLVSEVLKNYRLHRSGEQAPIEAIRPCYADYASWENLAINSGEYDDEIDRLSECLHGYLEPLEAPPIGLVSRSGEPAVPASGIGVNLSPGDTYKLRRTAVLIGTTTATLLAAIFGIVLRKYLRRERFVIGLVNANRGRPETENMMGFFVNLNLVPLEVDGATTIRDYIRQTHNLFLNAHDHQQVPYEHLVREIRKRDPQAATWPGAQVLFNFQRYSTGDADFAAEGLIVEPYSKDYHAAKYPLELNIIDSAEQTLSVRIAFKPAIWSEHIVGQIADEMRRLLSSVQDQLDRRIGDVEEAVQSSQQLPERSQWPQVLRGTGSPVSLVHERFEYWAHVNPMKTAIIDGQRHTEYSELYRRASSIANYLTSAGGKADQLVAIYLSDPVDIVVAILGVLSSGMAYLPIDTSYSSERTSSILAWASPRWCIVESEVATRDQELLAGCELVQIDYCEVRAEGNVTRCPASLSNAAYCIFTSGTTGQPKGVLISHQNVASLLDAAAESVNVSNLDVWTWAHSHAFDFSVWEILGALSTGGTLVYVDQKSRTDPYAFAHLVESSSTTIISQTPSAFRYLSNVESFPIKHLPRAIVLGGEALDFPSLKRWFSSPTKSAISLFNMYGITETTVHVTIKKVEDRESGQPYSLIGMPIRGWTCRVLNMDLNVSPVGVKGDLFVGGCGVARGYLRRAALTADRFIAMAAGTRAYRTGDVVAVQADGGMAYFGRSDHQVKLRGFRIEPGEVEANISLCRGVSGSAVVPYIAANGETQLAAFVVMSIPSDLESDTVLDELRTKIPGYMLPANIYLVDSYPMTGNGKIDRQRLTELAATYNGDEHSTHTVPTTDLEMQVAGIWREILNVPTSAMEDDFFSKGGHSLLATRLVARLGQKFKVIVPLKVLFESRTLGSVIEYIRSVDEAVLTPTPATPKGDRHKSYPLSPPQTRLWFTWQSDPDSAKYNIPLLIRIRGSVPLSSVVRALTRVLDLHEVFRLAFERREDGQVVQLLVDENRAGARDFVSIDPHREETLEEAMSMLVQQEAATPFDLAKGSPYRLRVIPAATGDLYVLFTFHHIIVDEWSLDLLWKEFRAALGAEFGGRGADHLRGDLDYFDYARAQEEWLASAAARSQLEYWMSVLVEEQPPIQLKGDLHPPSSGSRRGGTISLEIQHDCAAKLKEAAERINVGLPALMMACLFVLLHRYTGNRVITIGLPVANRRDERFQNVVGLFINMLAIRVSLTGDEAFSDFTRQVASRLVEGLENQEIPFERVVEELNPPRSADHTPIFQVIYNHIRRTNKDVADIPGVVLDVVGVQGEGGRYGLEFVIVETDENLTASINYSSNMLDEIGANEAARHILNIIETVAADVDVAIAACKLTGCANDASRATSYGQERARDVEVAIPPRLDIFQSSTKLAIATPTESVSYAQLHEQLDNLSTVLLDAGMTPRSLIGVSMAPGINLVTALLAIVRIGAAYVPIDPAYPAARRSHMLNHSRPSLLLVDSVSDPGLGLIECPVLAVDDYLRVTRRAAIVQETFHGHSKMYCIYTSGSTGLPKGVEVSRANVFSFIEAVNDRVGITAEDNVLLLTSISFDIAVLEIFLTLTVGATLVIPESDTKKEPRSLGDLMESKRVTVLQATPSLLRLLVAAIPDRRWQDVSVLSGGEPLGADLAHNISQVAKRLFNLYGPTEATVWSSCEEIVEVNGVVSLGRPLANTRLYILDMYLDHSPRVAVGELFIAGGGVAIGYARAPSSTAARFVPDGYSSAAVGCRMYRTGDLVRWSTDGKIVYVGRADHQVKLRGNRIELGEVEAVISRYPGIEQTAVVVQSEGDSRQQLVAYVVRRESRDITTTSLREYLEKELPAYMVPSHFVELDSMPSTPNGKIDRKALPSVEWSAKTTIAPRTSLEAAVLGVWKDVLGVNDIGVQDNFFDIGGHSVLAIQLADELGKGLGLRIKVAQIFEAQTVEAFAELITRGAVAEGESIVKFAPDGEGVPLFLLHYAGGSVLAYRKAASEWGKCGPVYGIQARSFFRQDYVEASVDEMAGHYAELIVSAFPGRERVNLLGWSFGGVLATALVGKLQGHGVSVGFLGLVDCVPIVAPELGMADEAVDVLADWRDTEMTTRDIDQWIAKSLYAKRWSILWELLDSSTRQKFSSYFMKNRKRIQSSGAIEEYKLLSYAMYLVAMRSYTPAHELACTQCKVLWSEESVGRITGVGRSLIAEPWLNKFEVVSGGHRDIINNAAVIKSIQLDLNSCQ